MYSSKNMIRFAALILTAVFLMMSAGAQAAEDTRLTLDNGMEVILKESHGSPMVACIIFVKSGSRYESRFENGITHFLEHLLFDGTANKTREELDNAISDLGGYINAFTRKDGTAYLVLLPKQFIEYGLTVQADMLFNSVFPESELPKERKVVIEEIRRSADATGAAADAFFSEKAYGATDYGRPVLGYEPFINNIPRDAIIHYWKQYYTPDKMTALIIGDFDTEAMKETVARVFGGFERSAEELDFTPSEMHRRLAEGKHRTGPTLEGQVRYDTVADVQSTYVNFSIKAPPLSDLDYLPVDLLASYLSLDEISPLKAALQEGAAPLATEVGVSLQTREEFTRLEISALCESPAKADTVIAAVLAELAGTAISTVAPDVIQGIKTTVRCDDIYYAEKLHYYGFIVAPMMMAAGWDFVRDYPGLLDSVTWDHAAAAAGRWFSNPDYIVTVVRPADSAQTGFSPTDPAELEVVAFFDTAQFPEYELVEGKDLTYPDVDSVSFELVDRAVYHREVLPNGLTVLVKSGSGSEVFAVNILGKNRSTNEPEGKAGITDFVNRCFEKGTSGRDASQLASDLAAIGANLTLCDNPWIPYDDRYTSRRFSFVKFETIEPFASEGFRLCCDLLLDPVFDSAEVENVRNGMLGVLRRNAGSPTKVARDRFYGLLFQGSSFANPIMGTLESLEAITVADLKEHHRRQYSPENMIFSIATSRDTAEVLSWVRDRLGSLEPAGLAAAKVLSPALRRFDRSYAHVALEKEQIAIYAGGTLPGANADDAVDLTIATSVLSSRLYSELRERKGLAYSTGASAKIDREFGWYYLSIATGSENYREALEGLELQTDKLAFDGPRDDEVNRARNRLWGRLMSAKLSRLNQAYYLGLDEFLGREPGYDQRLVEKLQRVSVQSVRQAASRHFRPTTWAVGTAGKKP
ncbi:MAG: insulinase family protein [bacterium]|nr:insulinase family protein [bacterium]